MAIFKYLKSLHMEPLNILTDQGYQIVNKYLLSIYVQNPMLNAEDIKTKTNKQKIPVPALKDLTV